MAALTVAEVAVELGVSERRVRQLATHRGLGRKASGVWLFSRRDVRKMLVRRPGNPCIRQYGTRSRPPRSPRSQAHTA